MTPILIAGPAVEPVTLAAMRGYLRLDHTDEDELVAAMIKAARLLVEASARRCLVEQTWRFVLDGWPATGVVRLPLSPLMRVDAIRIFDAAGEGAELAGALYRAEAAPDPPRIVVAGSVPQPGRSAEGIAIDATFGFGPGAAEVPAPFAQAIRLLVARWFEHRGDAPETTLPADIAPLVAPYRRARL
jgi:uncharacterized phiE125 gp8 family phage protein